MPSPTRGNGKHRRLTPDAAAKIQSPLEAKPTRFIYALRQWSIERRCTGWFVAVTTSGVPGNKPEWRGPFQTIETACLAIARGLAVEIADRHTRSIEFHKIGRTDPLFGLKREPRL